MNMPDVMIIQGKTETIFDNEDFARMLDEKLGSDAADYFRDALQKALETHDPSVCIVECDRVYRVQEHYEHVLRDIRDELGSWAIMNMTKGRIMENRDALYRQIGREL